MKAGVAEVFRITTAMVEIMATMAETMTSTTKPGQSHICSAVHKGLNLDCCRYFAVASPRE